MSASLRALSALVLFGSLGVLSIGCKSRTEVVPTPASAFTPVPMNAHNEIPTPPPATTPAKEIALDTSSPNAPLTSKTILPPPEQHVSFPKVRTPSDERLPSWVPVTGRLTVVSSHDLAKNLGMPAPPPDAAPAVRPIADPNEGGFVVRPLPAPARASSSITPRRGRHNKR